MTPNRGVGSPYRLQELKRVRRRVITVEIRAMLERDERLPHPAEVAVSGRHDTVILRGSVGSFRQRRAAVKIARSVHGVIAVAAERIDVTVADAWLTLKGEVKHRNESDAAFDAVSSIAGVGGITNEIKVITAGVRQ